MEARLFTATTNAEFEKCFEVMKELRPHLNFETFMQIYNEAHEADGYNVVALESAGAVVAVMGYRYLSDLVRGRHLYVDDLVTTASVRSKGLGAELLKYAEELAKNNNCSCLRLCTGIENTQGMKFYERNKWTKRSFAYVKKL